MDASGAGVGQRSGAAFGKQIAFDVIRVTLRRRDASDGRAWENLHKVPYDCLFSFTDAEVTFSILASQRNDAFQ